MSDEKKNLRVDSEEISERLNDEDEDEEDEDDDKRGV